MTVEEAIAIARKTSPTGWECYRDANCVLAKEVERLRSIVDKLPKTADVVSVVPGMRLFLEVPDRGMAVGKKRETSIVLEYERYTPGVLGCWRKISECYSTREAAEAAGGGVT